MHSRQVLMGNPQDFRIQGGANPHTRDPYGKKKSVDRELAISQWHGLASRLTEHGTEVFVIPPHPEHPGLVYPANAGFLPGVDTPGPPQTRCFHLSHLLPSRLGERQHYEAFVHGLGFNTCRIEHRFEGEADFFPFRNHYLLTFGRLERQRFAPRLGWPPYRRIYGFRTDRQARLELESAVVGKEIVELELIDERHYHGDTALCAFGPGRQFLLGFLEVLSEPSREKVRSLAGDGLVPLTPEDGGLYAANSFFLPAREGNFLFMPLGISDRLADQVRACGVQPVLVQASEFMAKGGGSIKCMIGDLGPACSEMPAEAAAFRDAHRYRILP